jgi:hypothetical protein
MDEQQRRDGREPTRGDRRPGRDRRQAGGGADLDRPGDDGTCGRAHSYDVRFSEAPITTDNFSSAQPIEGEPAPGEPGTAESFAIRLSRCNGYLAIRTYDADSASDSVVHPANVSAASQAIPVEGRASSCGRGEDRRRAVARVDAGLGSRHSSDHGPLPA